MEENEEEENEEEENKEEEGRKMRRRRRMTWADAAFMAPSWVLRSTDILSATCLKALRCNLNFQSSPDHTLPLPPFPSTLA